MSILILERYGAEISSKQMIMHGLADIATEIYVLVAVLARASRSYCIGVRNADLERYIATFIAQRARRKIEMLEADIVNSELNNRDAVIKVISQAVFQKKGYMCENPLTRTF
ncbi:hypothetical protein KPH14_007141 [Odynerus spinipes]|uniref:ACAD9/ACADV-like C-terminal domain-containing protein n=1 Tax=Odynerus spinipes TaxID=1348599 RepID=A0AAD9RRX3_9HYME|nr:hypothetical protein KPH14_007141 [Odynerus spinipes]